MGLDRKGQHIISTGNQVYIVSGANKCELLGYQVSREEHTLTIFIFECKDIAYIYRYSKPVLLYLRAREENAFGAFSLLTYLPLPKDGADLSLEHSRLSGDGVEMVPSPAKTARPIGRLFAGVHPCLESYAVTCRSTWSL